MRCSVCGSDTIPGVAMCPPCVIASMPPEEIPLSGITEVITLDNEVNSIGEGDKNQEGLESSTNFEEFGDANDSVDREIENTNRYSDNEAESIGEDDDHQHNPELDSNDEEEIENTVRQAEEIEQITILFFASLTIEQIQMFRKILDYQENGRMVGNPFEESQSVVQHKINVAKFGKRTGPPGRIATVPGKKPTRGPPVKDSSINKHSGSLVQTWVLGVNRIRQTQNFKPALLILFSIFLVFLGVLLLEDETVLSDIDGDGVPDKLDSFPNDPLYSSDSDGDGLADKYEWNIGTDSTSNDTDLDGVKDGEEVERGLNPLSGDSDNDGYSDLVDLYPLTDWVATVAFGGSETETNNICESAGSNRMTWKLATERPIYDWAAYSSGYGRGSGTYILDLPDDKSEVSVDFTIDATYTDCFLTNEEQLFWGVFGDWWQTHTDSDPGGDSQNVAEFSYVLTPGSTHVGTSEGSRTGDSYRDGGWLSRASINIQA